MIWNSFFIVYGVFIQVMHSAFLNGILCLDSRLIHAPHKISWTSRHRMVSRYFFSTLFLLNSFNSDVIFRCKSPKWPSFHVSNHADPNWFNDRWPIKLLKNSHKNPRLRKPAKKRTEQTQKIADARNRFLKAQNVTPEFYAAHEIYMKGFQVSFHGKMTVKLMETMVGIVWLTANKCG